jgi:hypothetical protein
MVSPSVVLVHPGLCATAGAKPVSLQLPLAAPAVPPSASNADAAQTAGGELGFFRIARGGNAMCMELQCEWATPKTWTEHNFHCDESGANCAKQVSYVDPSMSGVPWGKAVQSKQKPMD